MEEDFVESSSAVKQLTESINQLMVANQKATEEALKRAEADKEAAEQAAKDNKVDNDYRATKVKLKSAGEQLVKEFGNIANAGVKLAQTLGTQATKGVELELRNRLAAVRSLIVQDTNSIASKKQIEAAEQGLADAFVNVRDGFQISASGAQRFAEDLQKGFGAEFQATPETFRMLTQMGMSTTAQFEAFRKATGRASLSNNQLASLYTKNSLSFLLYGNSFAKAAANAERLGINLASVQGAQEGLVTNLDGTIDTVAQLNQLGAQLDFGTLIRVAEQEGPDALLAYVRRTIPEQLMQSASTRSLFKQLGISVEDYMKSGNKQVSAADDIEKKFSEVADKGSIMGQVFAFLSKLFEGGTNSFGGLITATGGLIFALRAASGALAAKGLTGLAGAAGAAAGVLTGLSGLGIGLTGATLGRSMVEQGNRGAGLLTAGIGGGIGGLLLASALAPLTGGGSLALYAGLAAAGGLGAGLYANAGKPATPANDMFSTGYGRRMLVTPNGAFALNNADDIIAGTNLFPAGTLQAGGNNSELVRKVDRLIDVLSSATTTINVGGMTQTVPRLNLVGVYSRNEVR